MNFFKKLLITITISTMLVTQQTQAFSKTTQIAAIATATFGSASILKAWNCYEQSCLEQETKPQLSKFFTYIKAEWAKAHGLIENKQQDTALRVLFLATDTALLTTAGSAIHHHLKTTNAELTTLKTEADQITIRSKQLEAQAKTLEEQAKKNKKELDDLKTKLASGTALEPAEKKQLEKRINDLQKLVQVETEEVQKAAQTIGHLQSLLNILNNEQPDETLILQEIANRRKAFCDIARLHIYDQEVRDSKKFTNEEINKFMEKVNEALKTQSAEFNKQELQNQQEKLYTIKRNLVAEPQNSIHAKILAKKLILTQLRCMAVAQSKLAYNEALKIAQANAEDPRWQSFFNNVADFTYQHATEDTETFYTNLEKEIQAILEKMPQ